MVTRRFGTSLACVAALGTLTLSGCSSGGGGEQASPSAATSPSSATGQPQTMATTAASPTGTPAPAPAPGPAGAGPDADLATTTFPVGLDRALAVADQTVPGGIVTKIELTFDRPANAWVWKIDSQQNTDQHEIVIDAQSARVLADDRDQESGAPVAVDPRRLTPEDAVARATALLPGSVAEWTLEYDDGVQRYSVDIRTGNTTEDVHVDVDSGTATRD